MSGQGNTGGHQGRPDYHKRKISGDVYVRGEVQIDLPSVKENRSAADRKKESREQKRFLVEGITLFFVVVVAVLNFLQTSQATLSANAAVESVRQSERNFRIEAAPYIDFVPAAPKVFKDGSELLFLEEKNFGKTPALHFRSLSMIILQSPGLPTPNFTFNEASAKGDSMLAPDADGKFPLNRRLSPFEVAAYRTGALEGYLGTGIWYRDIWGDPHALTYCLWYNRENEQWVAEQQTANISQTKHNHNLLETDVCVSSM
jgi:hypothetical protein